MCVLTGLCSLHAALFPVLANKAHRDFTSGSGSCCKLFCLQIYCSRERSLILPKASDRFLPDRRDIHCHNFVFTVQVYLRNIYLHFELVSFFFYSTYLDWVSAEDG